jgi:hypothetical protein
VRFLTVGNFRRFSGQCRHQNVNTKPLDCFGRMSAPRPHNNITVFGRTGIMLSVVMSVEFQIGISSVIEILFDILFISVQQGLQQSISLVQWCHLCVWRFVKIDFIHSQ